MHKSSLRWLTALMIISTSCDEESSSPPPPPGVSSGQPPGGGEGDTGGRPGGDTSGGGGGGGGTGGGGGGGTGGLDVVPTDFSDRLVSAVPAMDRSGVDPIDDVLDLAWPTGDATWAIDQRGSVFVTGDHGQSWTPAWTKSDIPLRGVSVSSNHVVYLVGDEGTLLRSENSDQHFVQIPAPTFDFSSVATNTAGTLALISDYEGALWLHRAHDLGIASVASVGESLHGTAVSPSGERMAAVGDSGAWLETADFGQTWIERPAPTERDLHAVAITESGLVAVGEAGVVVYWDAFGPEVTETLSDDTTLRALHIDPVSGTGLAIGDAGAALYTDDQGRSWVPTEAPFAELSWPGSGS